MIDLAHSEEQGKKAATLAALQPPDGDLPKELYVLGNRVTDKMLSETDLTLEEIMQGKS